MTGIRKNCLYIFDLIFLSSTMLFRVFGSLAPGWLMPFRKEKKRLILLELRILTINLIVN